MKRLFYLVLLQISLMACAISEPKSIEPPVVDYKSKNRITFLYDPLTYYVSAPPEMLDMAEEYCNSLEKISISAGTRDTSSWKDTAKYYDFECIKPRRTNFSHSEWMALQNNMLLRRIARNQIPLAIK